MVVFPVCARGGRRLVARPLRLAVPTRKRIEFATSWPRVREQQKPGVNSRWLRSQESFLSGFSDEKTKKNTFFQKRTGEVIENKGSRLKSEPDRTGKRSGEVVENTYLWKKRTGERTWPCCWK